MEYEMFVGLEVHAELSIKTKAFCPCKVSFGDEPNTNCCEICLGFPGTLPVLNKKAVEYTVKMGIVTNSQVNLVSKSARKNYFYPDLAKGYQISQSKTPVLSGGYIEISTGKIRINRIHLEEDAGKLVHDKGRTFVDYNRAGVPLIEIVTEPDIKSSEEAREFLEKVKRLLTDLEISECKMQEGNIRCDVNVSVRRRGENILGERCELKNINSFSAVVKSIEHEKKRQIDILENGGRIEQQTRRWDIEKNESFLMRGKENLADYRYMPEPDIPVIKITEADVERIRKEMPELFDEKVKRYKEKYLLSEYDAGQIAKDRNFTRLFENSVNNGADSKIAANFIMCDISAYMAKTGTSSDEITLSGEEFAKIIRSVKEKEITHTAGKELLEEILSSGKSFEKIVKEKDFTQISDRNILCDIVEKVLDENEKSVSDYKRGKTNALGYLVGQCVKKSQNKANPTVLKEILFERLEAML